MSKIIILLGALSLAACGGGGDAVDAGDPTPDAGGGACENPLVGASLGELGALVGASDAGDGDPFLQATLPGDDNALSVELYDGLGVFEGGLATGTFELTGDETNYRTCGMCVLIYAGWADTTMEPAGFYMADSGSVTIDEFTTGLTGSLANVHLIHVTIDTAGDFTSTPLNDGCDSTITSATFDLPF